VKRQEVTLLFFIAVASTAAAAFLANALFGNPNDARETVPVVERLPAEITLPDPLVFNERAIDPTRTVCIGVAAIDDPECADQFTPVEPGPGGEDEDS